jgi:hypothetical protein
MDLISLTNFQCRLAVRSWEQKTGIHLVVEYTKHGLVIHTDGLSPPYYNAAQSYINDFIQRLHANYGNN